MVLNIFFAPEENFLSNDTIGYFALAWIQENNQRTYPAFVLAPHIYDELLSGDDYRGGWSDPNTIDFVEELLQYILNENPNIDENQIFLTGHSAGGFGTWFLGTKLKDQIAALVPLSSAFSSESRDFEEINLSVTNGDFADLPVWSFIHRADADGNSSSNGALHGCRALFETFSNQGYEPVYTHWLGNTSYELSLEEINQEINAGKIHFYTEYNYRCSDGCHFAMTRALREPILFEWLFRQRKNR